MSRDVITLQPEVEEILREVAKRPGSGLLRVPRKDVARTVLERDTVVHARSAGLSAAERHLVQVYREEVAFALRQAAYHQLAEGAKTRDFVIDRAITPQGRVPSVRMVRVIASEATQSAPKISSNEEALELLERCVAEPTSSWPEVGRLAAASHRLVPAHQTRIYSALEARALGRPMSAIASLKSVIELAPAAEHARAAWSNLVECYMALGDYPCAHRAAVAVELCSGYGVGSLINRLLSAVRVHAEANAQECLDFLDSAESGIAGLEGLRAFLIDRQRWNPNLLDAAGEFSLRSLRDQAGPRGQELIDALVG